MDSPFVTFPAPWRKQAPIRVDFTVVNSDGLLRVRRSRFPGPLPKAGCVVRFVDTVNEVVGSAFMMNHNPDSDLVYLDIDWPTVRDDEPPAVQVAYTSGVQLLRAPAPAEA